MNNENILKIKNQIISLYISKYGISFFNENNNCFLQKDYLLKNKKEFELFLFNNELIFYEAKDSFKLLENFYNINTNILKKYNDVIIIHWLLNENFKKYTLKKLVKFLLDEINDFSDKDFIKDFSVFPIFEEQRYENWLKEHEKYCIKNSEFIYLIYKKLISSIKNDKNLNKIYYELEIPLIQIIKKMELKGFLLDIDYLIKLKEKLEYELNILSNEVYKLYGHKFDINSNKQLSTVLYSTQKGFGYDLPSKFYTNSGDLSTDHKALKYLVENFDSKIAIILLKYRELFKLYNTYVISFLQKSKDSCICPSYKQYETVTGRLISENPNFQQLPSRNDEYDIRKSFISREGYVFVIADLSQIELRITAHISEDEFLIDAYLNDKDIHQETADSIGCSRKVAKAINFSIIYGTSAYGLSDLISDTVEKSKEYIRLYFKKAPGVKRFIKKTEYDLKYCKKITNIIGGYRRFPNYSEDLDYSHKNRIIRQATNSKIQGSAAALIKIMMRNIDKEFEKNNLDACILAQVHDELIIETKENIVDRIMKLVKYEMENAVKLKVPIITEPKKSKCYGK